MKTKLELLIEEWRAAGFSEAIIGIALLTPMVSELK